jgi:8-amino-7-oxononanoate synthase
MPSTDWVSRWPLREAREADLYFYLQAIEAFLPHSHVRVRGHGEMLLLGGYSYLGLNGHPDILAAAEAALHHWGTGTPGARLLAGTLAQHQELEDTVARFKGTERAMTFTSGYAANVSVLTTLLGPADTVIGDKLNHASIVDGCRLSGAQLLRFRHNDMGHLAHCLRRSQGPGRRLVVVDAVFSMDGDIADLPTIVDLCRRFDAALMVDEAHAVGVLGEQGRGATSHFGLPPDAVDIHMGTFSKAIPSAGAYVAGSTALIEVLEHEARGFVYSGSLPAVNAAAAQAALQLLMRDPAPLQRLRHNTRHFAHALQAQGWLHGDHPTPVFPLVCGGPDETLRFARACQRHGLYVQAILPPVVPVGSARLRLAVSAAHRPQDLSDAVATMARLASEWGLSPQVAVPAAPLDQLEAVEV